MKKPGYLTRIFICLISLFTYGDICAEKYPFTTYSVDDGLPDATITAIYQDREGYLWGTNTIEGQDDFKGHTFKIFYKNENHVTWLDDKPYVTSPDIIEVIRRDSGEPITNTDIKEGDVVSVLGLRGRDAFKTPKGLEVLCPKYFDYDIPYIPIEKIMKEGRK